MTVNTGINTNHIGTSCNVTIKLVYTGFVVQRQHINIYDSILTVKTGLIDQVSSDMGIENPFIVPCGLSTSSEEGSDITQFIDENATFKDLLDYLYSDLLFL